MEQGYTTVQGAAEYLQVNPATIRRAINAEKLDYVRVGRAIRIPLEALTPEALTSLGE